MYRIRNREKPPYVMSGDGTVFYPNDTDSFNNYSLEAALRRLRKETGFPLKKERRIFDTKKD